MPWDFKKIKAMLSKSEDLTIDEEKELQTMLSPAGAPPENKPPKSDDAGTAALQDLVKALTAKNNELLAALDSERQSRESSAKAIEEQAKAEKAKKVSAKIEELVKAAIIAPSDEKEKDYWKQLLEANFDTASIIADKQIATNKESASSGNQGGADHSEKAPADKMTASRQNALAQISAKFK